MTTVARTPRNDVAVVAIGRNEGERLVRCLRSIVGVVPNVVYVDSGSTDDSVANARSLGADVVHLDTSVPFTAARARNEGYARAISLAPAARFVQFVDGDCELAAGWLEAGHAFLAAHDDVAIVCGRRRERHPDASPYNRLADMEWDGVPGDVAACGGDALVRVNDFEAAGRYDPTLIAGEDPELCFRVRRLGRRIVRLDADMTLHDAAMFRFEQWWRRNVRAGHAYAELAYLHGAGPERYRVKDVASIVFWGGALPLAGVGLAPVTLGASTMLLSGYGVLFSRVYKHRRASRHDAPPRAALYAAACTVGKLAEMRGVAEFAWNRFVKKQRTGLIEYKSADSNTMSGATDHGAER